MKKANALAIIMAVIMVFTCMPLTTYAASKPGKVKLSSVKQVAEQSVKIKWKKVSNAKKYQIYRSTSKNGTYKKIKTITKRKTVSYTDKTVSNHQKYWYKVRAIKGKKKGKFSAKKGVYIDYYRPRLTVTEFAVNQATSEIYLGLNNSAKTQDIIIDLCSEFCCLNYWNWKKNEADGGWCQIVSCSGNAEMPNNYYDSPCVVVHPGASTLIIKLMDGDELSCDSDEPTIYLSLEFYYRSKKYDLWWNNEHKEQSVEEMMPY